MDALDSVIYPLREFSKDSIRLVKRCHKPDRKEFTQISFRTAIGFVAMGFVGFFVKLVFISINNIIVGLVLVTPSTLFIQVFCVQTLLLMIPFFRGITDVLVVWDSNPTMESA